VIEEHQLVLLLQAYHCIYAVCDTNEQPFSMCESYFLLSLTGGRVLITYFRFCLFRT